MSLQDIVEVVQIGSAIADAIQQISSAVPPTRLTFEEAQEQPFIGPLPFTAFRPGEIFPDVPDIVLPPTTSRMAKRTRVDALTGGTGDINPQYVYFTMDIPAAQPLDQLLSASFQFPIQNFPQGANFVPIVEILKTSIMFDKETTLREAIGVAGNTTGWFDARLSMGGADNPGTGDRRNAKSQRTFFDYAINRGTNAGASTYTDFQTIQGAGECDNTNSHSIDHIDNDGHGILLFGNTITLGMALHGTTSNTISVRVTVMCFYRIKNVSLQEYLAGQAALGGTLAIS